MLKDIQTPTLFIPLNRRPVFKGIFKQTLEHHNQEQQDTIPFTFILLL